MIEISLIVIAITFVILSIFLIIVLVSLRKTLQHANKTLITARHKIEELSTESIKLLKSSTEISGDVKHKMLLLNSLFQALSMVGDNTLDKVKSIRSDQIDLDDEAHIKPKGMFSELTEWVATGIHLWNTVKKGR